MSRRIKRAGMWACAASAAVFAALWAWGFAFHPWAARGGLAVALMPGRAEIAWSDAALARQSIAYSLSYPEGSAAIMVAPPSFWRPSVERASIGVGAAGAPMASYQLSVLYVPLWPWMLLLAGAAGGLWWYAGKEIAPGHCRRCGYDLRGLREGKCPECGGLARLFRAAAGWLRRGAPIKGLG